ncbi:MAG: hypothetical protein II037_00905, partial [Bacteroidales bacterium]|nr:hypothetical protein [Bacteroidales bacterium]
MKTKSILLAIAVLLCSKAFAYDFSAVCESGQTLYYSITSNVEPYTVAVFGMSHYDEPFKTSITGDVIIPSSVNNDGIT